MEAEFYNATSFDYIHTIKALYAINFSQYGTSLELNENGEGFPVLRLNEFNSSFISTPLKSCKLLDFDTYLQLRLTKGDVLICRTNGNPKLVGKSALVPKDYNYAFASYLFRIRTKPEVINSATMVAFLNSKYGRMEIERFAMVGNQANFSPAKFKEITIPIFSSLFNKNIDNCTYKAFNLLERSECVYEQALTYLHQILGIDTIEFDDESITNKRFSDFIKCCRLDAEYYQPKYDKLFERLKTYQTKRLSEIVSIKKSIEPGREAYEEEGIPFIRVSNLTKFGITDTDIYLSPDKYKDVIRPKKDTILLSKDGSVGIAYKVDSDMDIITSGAILHLSLTDREVMPDYLTLVLNSIVVKMQAERDAGGSIIQHWKPSEIENVIIPILGPEVQQEITNKIRDSFKFRGENERLLNLAKTAVEVAIEQGENKALELLNSEIL